MCKSIKDEDFFECSAEDLAQRLLGKVLCYKNSNGKTVKYMITVTEAYPANDKNSYINRKHEPFGKSCLICDNNNKSGDCFTTPNGIHILGGESTSLNNERAYDHVLIRGGIKVD